MSSQLKDNWFLREIILDVARDVVQEARKDAEQETEKRIRKEERRKLEEEQRKREEERRQEIERWRQTVVGLVKARFNNRKLSQIAKGAAALIDNPQQLQDLILKIGIAGSAEEAKDYLLSYPESA